MTLRYFTATCIQKGMAEKSAKTPALAMDVQGHAVYRADAASSGKDGATCDDNIIVRNPEWLAKAVGMCWRTRRE